MTVKTVELVKPLLINGAERKSLNYDIEELTISRIAQAERMKTKLVGESLTTSVAQMDYPLQICIGIQAILAVNKDIAEEDLLRISGYDVTKIAGIGMNFFIKPASEEEVKQEPLQEAMQNTTDAQ